MYGRMAFYSFVCNIGSLATNNILVEFMEKCIERDIVTENIWVGCLFLKQS